MTLPLALDAKSLKIVYISAGKSTVVDSEPSEIPLCNLYQLIRKERGACWSYNKATTRLYPQKTPHTKHNSSKRLWQLFSTMVHIFQFVALVGMIFNISASALTTGSAG